MPRRPRRSCRPGSTRRWGSRSGCPRRRESRWAAGARSRARSRAGAGGRETECHAESLPKPCNDTMRGVSPSTNACGVTKTVRSPRPGCSTRWTSPPEASARRTVRSMALPGCASLSCDHWSLSAGSQSALAAASSAAFGWDAGSGSRVNSRGAASSPPAAQASIATASRAHAAAPATVERQPSRRTGPLTPRTSGGRGGCGCSSSRRRRPGGVPRRGRRCRRRRRRAARRRSGLRRGR